MQVSRASEKGVCSRRKVAAWLGAQALLSWVPAQAQAQAQDAGGYPARPIRIIVPTPAGGPLDVFARVFAEKLQAAWGQPVVVDNRTGANGAIAYAAVAKAPADGYTLVLSLSSLVQNALLMKSAPYALSEFVPVSVIAYLPTCFAVHSRVPARDLAQFLGWARTQDSGVDYGTAGQGSLGNIMGATLAKTANVRLVHVPFRGEPIQAMVAQQIPAGFATAGSLAQHAKSGDVRLLAVAAPARLQEFPEVPTFAEAGYPQLNLFGWSIAAVPAGTPAPIVAKLARELGEIVKAPDVTARMHGFGFLPAGSDAENARKLLNDEVVRWSAAIKLSGLSID